MVPLTICPVPFDYPQEENSVDRRSRGEKDNESFPHCFSRRSVPKFMKRMKVPDYREKSVFGVPLIIHVQRCGFPLPLCLQQALSHLRTHCLDQVGDVL